MQSAAPQFPLVQTILHFLVHAKEERYALHPLGPQALQEALEALFLTQTDHRAALQELLQLIALLKDCAPTAAQKLMIALMSSKQAMALLDDEDAGLRSLRSLQRFVGETAAKRAPMVEQLVSRRSEVPDRAPRKGRRSIRLQHPFS